jgi:WhiB family transcriptional regulator, redox-sensing transcriptional regulator
MTWPPDVSVDTTTGDTRSTPHPPGWHRDAACAQVGGDWWFPEPHERIPAAVLRVCADCPARRACLLFALQNDVLHGVWAALNPAELWALRQRILADEPASAVIDAGMDLGTARRDTDDLVVYRSAPWNPPLIELDRQLKGVRSAIAPTANAA